MTGQLKNSQTFRVFFSSPFKGLEEEREELTRKYIPEIQHRCAEMGLQFVAVDMRWGISAESAQQAQTVNICFREIDRSDMLVNFFGQRYGWQGHTDALLQENINMALGNYPWLDNFRDRSVTELELQHGFLNNPGQLPTVICFRDKAYDDVMKGRLKDKAINYTAENEDSRDKLTELKKKAVESQSKALAVHLDYPNPHEGARLIYEAIIKHMKENVLKQSEELSKREKDITPHRAFAASRTAMYVGSQGHYDVLNNALKSGESDRTDKDKEKSINHVVVVGPAGCGKSSLLCNWLHTHVCRLPNVIAIPYYVGCAPSTRDPEQLLDFLYGELEHHLGEGATTKDASENPTEGNDNNNNTSSTENGVQEQKNDVSKEYSAQTDGKHTNHDTTTTVAENPVSSDAPAAYGLDIKDAGASGDKADSSVPLIGGLNLFMGHQSGESSSLVPRTQPEDEASSTEPNTQDKQGDDAAKSDDKNANETATKEGGMDQAATDSSETSGGQADETDGKKMSEGKTDETDGKKMSEGKTDGTATDGSSKTSDSNASDVEKDKAKAKETRPKGRELQYQVTVKLEKLVARGHTVLLVFDAINRLVAANKTSQTLYWLPEKLCGGVVCVVSTDDTDQASLSVLQNVRSFNVLKLDPLDEAVQREVCVNTLKKSGKELSPAQLQRVVTAKQTENPLFLKIVLAELSIFGYFRKLDEKIDSLIQLSGTKELLQNCLERLEADYNDPTFEGNLVGEILKALYVARQGLTENEICNIFNIHSNVWSPIYFAMEFFIVSHLGNLGFAFNEIREAVKERYLPDAKAESKARRTLITYFDGIRKQLQPWTLSKKLAEKPLEHAVTELVWLLHREQDKEAVALTLSDLAVFRIMDDAYDLDMLELWQWTGLKWSEVCTRLLKALDSAITECYLAIENDQLDTTSSPGVKMRVAVSHMRAFFDLANYTNGSERVLEREIRILENAEGKMDEERRKELLRDAYYYLACTYASQDRYQEARALHQKNMARLEKALEEKEDMEVRKQIAYTHNGLGILLMNSGEYERSIEHLKKSTEFHDKNKDRKNEAAGYTNLSLVYMYMQKFQMALDYNQRALEAYEEGVFGQLTMDIGNVYTNLGLVHRRMKNLNKAELAYLKSLEIKANAVGWDHLVIATAFMNLGTLEMHRKHYDKAEEWTRKAIGVYQANELAVTKKEYRRCRENLFANMLKQEKYEEVLPFYIEIFDILKQNDWLDECLAAMHRRMVGYMIDNKPEMLDKAEEITLALIDSSKAHPQNYGHLIAMDQERPENERPERPYKYSLDACMNKFPTHAMYDTIVELKMEYFLLPKEDRKGVRTLLRQVVVNFTDSSLESIVTKLTTVAREQKKEEFWFQCLKALLEEDPANQKTAQLFIRLCVHVERPSEALTFIDSFLGPFRDAGGNLRADDVKPLRTRLDAAKVLVARGDALTEARQLLLLVTAKSLNVALKKEAQATLDSLPEAEEDDVKMEVTSAA